MGRTNGANYANEVIVISTVIDNILREKYDRTDAHLIYNGVNKPVPAKKRQLYSVVGVDTSTICFGRRTFCGGERIRFTHKSICSYFRFELQIGHSW